jgi:hypothetical protein
VTLESNGAQIRIIDTPGLSFELNHEAENKELLRGRDILLRSRGRIDKLKDPSPPSTLFHSILQISSSLLHDDITTLLLMTHFPFPPMYG